NHALAGALPRTPRGFQGIASLSDGREEEAVGCLGAHPARKPEPSTASSSKNGRWTWPLIVSGQATGPIAARWPGYSSAGRSPALPPSASPGEPDHEWPE